MTAAARRLCPGSVRGHGGRWRRAVILLVVVTRWDHKRFLSATDAKTVVVDAFIGSPTIPLRPRKSGEVRHPTRHVNAKSERVLRVAVKAGLMITNPELQRDIARIREGQAKDVFARIEREPKSKGDRGR